MDLTNAVIQLGVLLFALSFHEMAHAWAAYKLGDSTAKDEGRLTINPLVHLDPVMSVAFPALLWYVGSPVLFGAARPVPVNTANLAHPKRDHMWVAAAGPISNVILAVIGLVVVNVFWQPLAVNAAMGASWAAPVRDVMLFWVSINLILATFNMIPLYPLDGSWILSRFLSGRAARAYAALRPFGFVILILLMFSGALWSFIYPVLRFAGMFIPA